MNNFAMFLRRNIYCRFGIHTNMDYDSGLANDIGRAGTCLDCGYRSEGIKRPKMPEVKQPRNNRPPEPPPTRIMKEPLAGGLIETEESKQKGRDWKNYIRGYRERLGCDD